MQFEVRRSSYSPGLRQARHSHDYSNVTIVLAGKIEEATALGEYCALPGSVVSKGAGCEHEDRVGGHGARTLCLRFAGAGPFAEATWAWFETPDIVRLALAVQRASNGKDLETAALALIEGVSAAPSGGPAPRWVGELRETIERDHDRGVRFDAFARGAGLHPVYVSRAFRRYAGMSPCEYLRAVRIRHARHVLSSTSRSVGAVAAECGFADSSHLCRTFSEFLGATPIEYRKLTSRQVQSIQSPQPGIRTMSS